MLRTGASGLVATTALGAQGATLLSVSNASPAYNKLVTLTTTVSGPGGSTSEGTASFYEDSGVLLGTPVGRRSILATHDHDEDFAGQGGAFSRKPAMSRRSIHTSLCRV